MDFLLYKEETIVGLKPKTINYHNLYKYKQIDNIIYSLQRILIDDKKIRDKSEIINILFYLPNNFVLDNIIRINIVICTYEIMHKPKLKYSVIDIHMLKQLFIFCKFLMNK